MNSVKTGGKFSLPVPRNASRGMPSMLENEPEKCINYMNLYNVYFVSKGTGPRTVQVEALNQSGAKGQVEARYPGAYNIISNQLPSSAKKK